MTSREMSRDEAAASYRTVRDASLFLCEPLETEDFAIQTMPDVSPPKWHLAHTTWFFEAFLLGEFVPDYRPVDPRYHYLFNSYYETVGRMHPRHQRGLLSRPTVAQVLDYRARVDRSMLELIDRAPAQQWQPIAERLTLGLQHEQQHQELLLMDIKHILATNPLRPAYREDLAERHGEAAPPGWVEFAGGVHELGHSGNGFAFDNERPAHPVLLGAFRLADRCVVNAEYLEFMAAGGYGRSELWLADGWAVRQREAWQAPMYWERDGESWQVYTLAGMRPVDPVEPVVHVSFYEADAFARWTGRRLPTEFEWELGARDLDIDGNMVESGHLHPRVAGPAAGLQQMFGDVWEWTASPYVPYPGFKPLPGSLGEYNGKFMCNQQVLRGGSCATPRSHLRPTYRNFFYPHQRWCFQGLRLAESAQ